MDSKSYFGTPGPVRCVWHNQPCCLQLMRVLLLPPHYLTALQPLPSSQEKMLSWRCVSKGPACKVCIHNSWHLHLFSAGLVKLSGTRPEALSHSSLSAVVEPVIAITACTQGGLVSCQCHGKLSPGTPASLTPVPIAPTACSSSTAWAQGWGGAGGLGCAFKRSPWVYGPPRLHQQFAQLSKMPPIVDQKGLVWALPPTCTVPSRVLQMLMGCGGGCLQTRGCLQCIFLPSLDLTSIHQAKLRAMCSQRLQVFGPQLLCWMQHCWALGVLVGRTREDRKWGNVKKSKTVSWIGWTLHRNETNIGCALGANLSQQRWLLLSRLVRIRSERSWKSYAAP